MIMIVYNAFLKQILHFLVHYIYFTALITSYFADLNDQYRT